MPLKPLFTNFISEPFQTNHPILGSFDVEGDYSGDFKIKSIGPNLNFKGKFRWDRGKLAFFDKDQYIKDIYLDIPIWYKFGIEIDKSKSELTGKADFSIVNFPYLIDSSYTLPIKARPNFLHITSPLNIMTPGGKLIIKPIKLHNIFMPSRSINTGADIEIKDISPLLSELWPRPINGNITGKLSSINFQEGKLITSGQIQTNVFGGKIILSDLSADGILTSSPLLLLNTSWEDLDLLSLTKQTQFGEIEGSLRGSINGLEIAHGQPQKFDLILETVKKRGVKQRISVKAIDNIAKISGGTSPFSGLAGIYATFFKKFPYSKIHTHAFLENDGLWIKDNYIMRRGSFSGVDIVNKCPNCRIPFKTITKSIKRVLSSEMKPIIN